MNCITLNSHIFIYLFINLLY